MDKKDLKQATSVFDFINVNLYEEGDIYSVKVDSYYIWSELNQELQEYEVSPVLKWENLKEYVEKKLVYLR